MEPATFSLLAWQRVCQSFRPYFPAQSSKVSVVGLYLTAGERGATGLTLSEAPCDVFVSRKAGAKIFVRVDMRPLASVAAVVPALRASSDTKPPVCVLVCPSLGLTHASVRLVYRLMFEYVLLCWSAYAAVLR